MIAGQEQGKNGSNEEGRKLRHSTDTSRVQCFWQCRKEALGVTGVTRLMRQQRKAAAAGEGV